MALPPRVAVYVSVAFIAWGIVLQAYVARNTANANAAIERYKAAVANSATTAASGDGEPPMHELGESTEADLAHFSATWREARDKVTPELMALRKMEQRVEKELNAFREAKNAFEERLSQFKEEFAQMKQHNALADGHPQQTPPTAVDLAAHIDDIVSQSGYGADREGANAHKEVLQLGVQVVHIAEMFCLLENWRVFFDPLIKAMEARPDRMLYNYI
jgi:hypothetical protein